MKRISLMLALFLTLSFGMASAQGNGSLISLNSVDGLVAGQIPCNLNSDVTFHFDYLNGDGTNKVKGMTNGFELSATGGATWVGSYADEFTFDPTANFDLIWSHNEFSWDGALADTIGFGGSVVTGPGLPPGYSGPGIAITVNFGFQDAADGETFCIDSAFYRPSGSWMWAYGAPGSYAPDWQGPHCFDLYRVPNQPPIWTAENPAYNGDHCVLVVLDYDAQDQDDPKDPITFSLEGGVGNVVTTEDGADGIGSCQLTYAPTLADVGGGASSTLGVNDGVNPTETTVTNMTFTNAAPAFTGGCNETVDVGMGNTGEITMTYDDVDCDPTFPPFIPAGGVTPAPAGTVYMNGDVVTFDTHNPLDGGILFTVTVCITDGLDTVCCPVYFNVLEVEPFEVQIEKTHGTFQGMHEIVDVTVNKGSEDMGGFDILIAYDASALFLQAAIPGDIYALCGWEYFNYRYGPFGNCGNQCPSGLVRVVGIAETNNGPNHPTCFNWDPKPFTLFSLDFLVSNDRTLECMYVPIRFFWMDCGDNSIAYHPVDDPLASVQGVSRYVIDFDLIGHIEDMFTGFPTYTGVQWECFDNDPNKPLPVQFVDFYNGGIDIVCADSIDDRGDINLNGTANEIADAVLFSNYFVKGIGVFNVNVQGQIAATDVNADGLTLSVADLVYQIRIIVGDALPYPKLGAEAASFAYENGVMSVDTKMGAAFIVLEGNVDPRLLADNMEMNYAFDGRNTKVLISKIEREAGFVGEFLAFDANIVSVEMATYDGAPVAAKNVPLSYSLHQNYPNPFNPKTTIAFALPTGGDYSLTIYNVTGQKVTSFSGSADAGMVSIDWDAANMASGVYFYKLDTENFVDTKKMVLLK